jgi:hypothetical protein
MRFIILEEVHFLFYEYHQEFIEIGLKDSADIKFLWYFIWNFLRVSKYDLRKSIKHVVDYQVIDHQRHLFR